MLTHHLVNLDIFKLYYSLIIIIGQSRYLGFQLFI